MYYTGFRYNNYLLSFIIMVFCFLLPAENGYGWNIIEKDIISLNILNKPDNPDSDLSFHIHAGRMTGEGNEYVVITDRTLSKLIWKIDELYMAGGGFNYQISSGKEISADLWLKTQDGQSTMDDYDWMIDGLDWTHWSHHDDTIVTKAGIFDISYKYTPLYFREKHIKFKYIAGYRLTDFEWEARGGSYIYTPGDPPNSDFFREDVGTFPDNQLGITYEQIFHTPYIGLEIDTTAGIFFLNSKLSASYAVFGKAIDQHHLRDLVTRAYFYWGHMISADISAGVNLNSRISLSAAGSYMKYGGLRGDSAYEENGYVTVYEDLEKADFESIMFSIAFTYMY